MKPKFKQVQFPKSLYDTIEKQAKESERSINKQIIFLLKKALKK